MLVGEDAMGINIITVGSIVYGPLPPQPIPTLSGSMLVVLGLLFAVLAFRVLRAHSASKPLASIVAVGVLVLGAASGNQLIQKAQALTIPVPCFCNPSGGVYNVGSYAFSPFTPINNGSGKPQRIISVTASPPYLDSPLPLESPSDHPRCTVELILQNNTGCYINFTINFTGPPVPPLL